MSKVSTFFTTLFDPSKRFAPTRPTFSLCSPQTFRSEIFARVFCSSCCCCSSFDVVSFVCQCFGAIFFGYLWTWVEEKFVPGSLLKSSFAEKADSSLCSIIVCLNCASVLPLRAFSLRLHCLFNFVSVCYLHFALKSKFVNLTLFPYQNKQHKERENERINFFQLPSLCLLCTFFVYLFPDFFCLTSLKDLWVLRGCETVQAFPAFMLPRVIIMECCES